MLTSNPTWLWQSHVTQYLPAGSSVTNPMWSYCFCTFALVLQLYCDNFFIWWLVQNPGPSCVLYLLLDMMEENKTHKKKNEKQNITKHFLCRVTSLRLRCRECLNSGWSHIIYFQPVIAEQRHTDMLQFTVQPRHKRCCENIACELELAHWQWSLISLSCVCIFQAVGFTL